MQANARHARLPKRLLQEHERASAKKQASSKGR